MKQQIKVKDIFIPKILRMIFELDDTYLIRYRRIIKDIPFVAYYHKYKKPMDILWY